MKKYLCLVITLSLSLSSCTKQNVTTERSFPQPIEDVRDARNGSILNDNGELGFDLLGSSHKNNSSNINEFLWKAALEAISFMPLVSSDIAGGVIITDWYSIDNNTNEQFKFNIIISGKALNKNTIKITGFKRIKKGGDFVDSAISNVVVEELRDKIFANANRDYLASTQTRK